MRTVLILLVGACGLWLTFRHLRRNIAEIKAKPKDQVQTVDKLVNYPLMVLWFGYLIVFFCGLILNNLVFQ